MKRFIMVLGFLLACAALVQAQTSQDKKGIEFEPRRGMVGLQIREENGHFFVEKVLRNSPAEESGLEAGDRILRVADRDLTGLSLNQVYNIFNGDPMTDLEVAVMRQGREVPPLRIGRINPRELTERSPDLQPLPAQTPQGIPGAGITPSPPGPPEETPSPELADQARIRAWQEYLEQVCGVRAVLLDDSFAQKVGALFTEGLLVLDIVPGKPAIKARLEKWDIIYRIEGRPVRDYFRAVPPPSPQQEPRKTLRITLMGITGEKDVQL